MSTAYPNIDILTPELTHGDAISNHSRHLCSLLNSQGYSTKIVVEHIQNITDKVVPIDRWRPRNNILILQHGIGSKISDLIINKQIPIILNYHNITPPEFLEPWHLGLYKALTWGQKQLLQLAELASHAIADSSYNAVKLTEIGYSNVSVAPVLFDLEKFYNTTQSNIKIPKDGGNILFVGRIVPNKCQHELIGVLKLLLQRRPKAQLVLIGRTDSARYIQAIETLVREWNLENNVIIKGKVSSQILLQEYHKADIFVCLSDHEGFGIPIVEAMASQIPVVAFNSTAIPETIGKAGILLQDKNSTIVAAAIDRVLGDNMLRTYLQTQGTFHSKSFDLQISKKAMWNTLKPLL